MSYPQSFGTLCRSFATIATVTEPRAIIRPVAGGQHGLPRKPLDSV